MHNELHRTIHSSIYNNWKKINSLGRYSFFMSINLKQTALEMVVHNYDEKTAKHMKLVGYLTFRYASILGIDSKDLEHAAYLHDIGKLYIPIDILHPEKPQEISPLDKKIKNLHIKYSEEILRQLRFPEKILALVRFHETPFKEISDNQDLYENGIFLPSIIRVIDILVSALENPEKYGNGSFELVLKEIEKHIEEERIQKEAVYIEDSVNTLGDLFNEAQSHFPSKAI